MECLPSSLREVLGRQGGAVSRSQVAELGYGDHDVRRWRRRRLLVTLHPGVYLDHTGAPTWTQRAWGAVLASAPAALHGCCALRAVHGPGWREHDDAGPVHVAVETERRVSPPEGVVVQRVVGLHPRVQWVRSPPRMRTDDAVVDAAACAPDDLAAVRLVAAAVGARTTTARRLLRTVSQRSRLARRDFLVGVLHDVDQGACSVLELLYLRDVERAHGLPRGVRQAPRADRPGLRDVLYADHGVVVELDGRMDHTRSRDRDRDLERDLAALTDGLVTARVGWGQTVGAPCRTAHAMADLLQRRGWDLHARPCPRCT